MHKKKPGRPTDHENNKKRHGIAVTDVAWRGLQKLAKECGVSVSEYLEQLGRLGTQRQTED